MADSNDLIATIYDAAIDPSGWEEVVRRIVEATKSIQGGLLIHQTKAAHLSAVYNADPVYDSAFVENWHLYRRNPVVAFSLITAPGELRTCTHIYQSDAFKASVFYNEFVRPQGWADSVGVGLLRGPNSHAHLVVHRSPDAIWVDPPEWHLLETLAPHLKRAAEIHQLVAGEWAAKESLGSAVAAAGFAAFLLTKECRVIFANAKAEEHLRCGAGLRCGNGRLIAATAALSERMSALVRGAEGPKAARWSCLAAKTARRSSPMSSRSPPTARRQFSTSRGPRLPFSSSILQPIFAPKSHALPQETASPPPRRNFSRSLFAATALSPPRCGSKSPNLPRAATRRTSWQKPEPHARLNSSAASLNPPA